MLLICAMAMVITGLLLFPVASGTLGYYEDGLYGLLLVIISLQIITLGKTPFGDVRRSRVVFVVGSLIAAVGIVTCFVPDLTGEIPRLLLFVCLGPGGLMLLVRALLDEGKVRTWWRMAGVGRHLVVAASSVYVLSMVASGLLLFHGALSATSTALVVLLFGIAIGYLAGVLRIVYGQYPEAQTAYPDNELSTDQSLILLTGLFMVLLGALLIPVNLGALPFAGSAQLGLLMVIFAVQMLASGNTPLGPFPRSWLMIGFGPVFAGLGIVSCIIPDILVLPLTVLVGLLNIASGAITLVKTGLSAIHSSDGSGAPVPAILVRLAVVQLFMGVLAIAFGTSMLVAQLIPGLILGAVLVANGFVLLYLLRLLIVVERLQSEAQVE